MQARWAIALAVAALAAGRVRAGFQNFPICTDGAEQCQPAASGSIVVWCDQRNGNPDIYGKELTSGQEFPICLNLADQTRPAISGNVVVWQDFRSGNWDIYGATIDASDPNGVIVAESVIVTGPDGQQCGGIHYPRISVELRRAGEADSEYMAYDMSTGFELVASADAVDQTSPRISGDILVWEDWRNDPGDGSNRDIYGYDLLYGREFVVTTDPADQDQPDVDGRVVAWRDERDGLRDIYAADLDTSDPNFVIVAEYPVTDLSWGAAALPRVGQEVIVTYLEGDPDGPKICGYSLPNATKFEISTGTAAEDAPDISGDLVVWTDTRNGNWDIYGAVIPEPASAAALLIGAVGVLWRRRR